MSQESVAELRKSLTGDEETLEHIRNDPRLSAEIDYLQKRIAETKAKIAALEAKEQEQIRTIEGDWKNAVAMTNLHSALTGTS